MKKLIALALFIICCLYGGAQVIVIPLVIITDELTPEHGFLPGAPFPYLPMLHNHNLHDLKLRVELYDYRDSLPLPKIDCSQLNLSYQSEMETKKGMRLVQQYLDTLFSEAGAVLDTTSTDVVKIKLYAIDSRIITDEKKSAELGEEEAPPIIGHMKLQLHGLCQLKIKYRDQEEKTYCTDISDLDKHSPLGPKAFVTRLTASRYITAAAIREVMEKFFSDMEDTMGENWQKRY